jgi:hypothetical protein
MRTCSTCKNEYENYGQRCSLCRPCKRAYDKQWYAKQSKASKRRKQDLQNIRRETTRDWVRDYRKNKGCKDCGTDDFRVLEFDHLPEHEKEFNVADGVAIGYGKEKILKEMEKCEVVCANCHRIRTHQRITEHSSAW